MASAAAPDFDGLWQGFDGEWGYVARHVAALAEAIPTAMFGWRPVPGVRCVSEVLMHIAAANFGLLHLAGRPLPADCDPGTMEKAVTAKADVTGWLRRSFDAVKEARAGLKPGDGARHVTVMERDATVDGVHLRILVHANEHMGQLVAYARTMGVAPPWSV